MQVNYLKNLFPHQCTYTDVLVSNIFLGLKKKQSGLLFFLKGTDFVKTSNEKIAKVEYLIDLSKKI